MSTQDTDDLDAVTIDITRWLTEQADPDHTDETIEHLVDSGDGPFDFAGFDVFGDLGDADQHVRFNIHNVEHDGELVDYTFDIPAPLLRDAVDALDE